MSHPFEVGKRYRNRVGEYVVEWIEGDNMKVRYIEGGTLLTNVNIQARIWENIQFEQQMAHVEERRRQAQEARSAARRRRSRTRRTRVPPKYDGFEAGDFDFQGRGIAWSGRRDLGRVLAYELTRRARGTYDHWIVPYQSEVHVAQKDHYDTDNRELNAAFFVSTSEDGASYGLHVGKPAGKEKPNWPWSMLMDALAEEEALRESLRSVMGQHQLRLVAYATEISHEQVGRITVEEDNFVWQHEAQDQEVVREMTGKQAADYLHGLAPGKHGDLYLGKWIPAREVIKAGSKIVDEIVAVCESLLPLYEAATGD
jgi:hypothetical protein